MAVRGGSVAASRIALSEIAAQRQVNGLREAIAPGSGSRGPGPFDPAAAHALYRALLEPVESALAGASTLIVAPDGPLLALPFGVLLTGPADAAQLATAPWLIRRHAIIHIPGPQTFVTLRQGGGTSTAPLPYVGFGDFTPASAAQLARSFPSDRCAADARLAQGLVRLPGTRQEVITSAELVGAPAGAVKLGGEFTAAGLRAARLGEARIVHLATHALLPGELSCLTEPSIVLSPPAGAPTAEAAFLKSSDVLALKLDADLVVLSACNTGGPAGAGGGEALSGLARSFFYAGARGLLVTHWAVDDLAAALIVPDALRRQHAGQGSAQAVRGAQLVLLDEAGKRLPAVMAHPYFWAPFVMIGEGRRGAAPQTAGLPSAPAL
jgi:CHAT domain-containing protein